MAGGRRRGGRGRWRTGGGFRPAEGAAARERRRPGRVKQPVAGAGGGGEEKAAARDGELG